MSTYMSHLQIQAKNKTQKTVAGEVVGLGHDETTFNGEAFATTYRLCTDDVDVIQGPLRVRWFETSLDNEGISSVLISDATEYGHIMLKDVFEINCDSVAAKLLSFKSTVSPLMPYADLDQCLPHTGNHSGDAYDTRPQCWTRG